MKKRILFVTYNYWPPQFGGELILSIERFQSLVKRGFEVTVLTSRAPGLPSYQMDEGLSVFRSPQIGANRLARLLRRFVYFFWVSWQLFQHSFEFYYQGDTSGIDHVTSALSVWFFTRIARLKRAHCVIVDSLADTEQTAFDPHGWEGFWRLILFGCFDSIVAVGPRLYQDLKAVFPQSARLIVNGVRDDLFLPVGETDRRQFRQQYNLGETDVIFSFLGSVGYRKGFDLLAEAFAGLVKKHPNWHLWVIGPVTPQESQNLILKDVQAVTRPLQGMTDQVTYWGRVNDRLYLNRLLSASDVFVFPSRREGMGLAPVEAMAAGVPAIIARIPDITDLANIEGETGLYVPVGDTQALAEAMEKLGHDPALRRDMGRKAIQRVRAGFSWEGHLDKWQGFLEDCLAGK